MGPQVPLPSHPHHSATLNGVNGMRSNPLFSHEDTSGVVCVSHWKDSLLLPMGREKTVNSLRKASGVLDQCTKLRPISPTIAAVYVHQQRWPDISGGRGCSLQLPQERIFCSLGKWKFGYGLPILHLRSKLVPSGSQACTSPLLLRPPCYHEPSLPWQARAHNHHNRAARTEAPGVGDKTQHSTTRQGAGAAQSHGVDELLVTLQQLLKDVAAQSESAVRLQAPPGAAAGAGMVAASGSNHPGTHTSAVGRARSTSGRAQGQGLNRAPPSLEQAPHELPAFPPFQGPQQSPLLIATHSGFPDYYQHHHNDVQDLQHHNRFTEPHSGFHGNGAQPIGPGPGPPSHLQLPPAAVAWSPVSASVPTTGASSAPAAYLAPPLGQGSLAAAWQENAASISPSPSMFPSHAAAPASFPLPAAPPLQSMHESPAYISLEPYYPASDPFLHASPASQAYPNQ
eukprot:449207-Pelagomonas_calceolata.AAC.1